MSEGNALATMSDHELLLTRAVYDSYVKENVEQRDRADMEIRTRMEARDATVILDEEYTCELERGTPSVDLDIMEGLKELLPQVTIAEGYTPEHEETVPEKWNLTKVNKWAKAGGDVAKVIEDAKTYGSPRLVVKKKGA